MEIKLKPCPFCGSEAKEYSSYESIKIQCSNYDCQAEMVGWFDEFEEAAAAWNRRTEDMTRTQYQIVLPIEIANEKEFDHIRNWLADGDTSCAMLITLIEGAEKELKRYRAEV